MRFQVEAVAHEMRNPGWFKGWLARQGTPSSQAASGARLRPPMSPWMAFVRVSPLSCTALADHEHCMVDGPCPRESAYIP